jgi:hypothetical protein
MRSSNSSILRRCIWLIVLSGSTNTGCYEAEVSPCELNGDRSTELCNESVRVQKAASGAEDTDAETANSSDDVRPPEGGADTRHSDNDTVVLAEIAADEKDSDAAIDAAGGVEGELMGPCFVNGSCVRELICEQGICVPDCNVACTANGCDIPCGDLCGDCPHPEWLLCNSGACVGRTCGGASYGDRCERTEDCCEGLVCVESPPVDYGIWPVCMPGVRER